MRIVRPVVQTVSDVTGRVRDLNRLQEVARVLAGHGLGMLVAGTDIPGMRNVGRTFASTPDRMKRAIEQLGPTYVKRTVRMNSIRKGLLGGSRFWLAIFGLGYVARWSGKVTKRGEMPVRFSEELRGCCVVRCTWLRLLSLSATRIYSTVLENTVVSSRLGTVENTVGSAGKYG